MPPDRPDPGPAPGPGEGGSPPAGPDPGADDRALLRMAVRFGLLDAEREDRARAAWNEGVGGRTMADVLVQEGFLSTGDLEMLGQIFVTGTTPAQGTAAGRRPEPGARLGEFRIVRQIARGSMGVVYEAVQESLGRTVALKVLPADPTRDERIIERFRREAGAAGRLDHPGIVKVLSVGEDGGFHYIAMDYVRGKSLDRLIETERLPLRRVVEIARDAALALDSAHGAGVIHRDIKPGNIMVTPGGKVLIADFGLARMETTGTLTRMDEIVGTPMYMSPEQARGDREHVDARTDVYSLGATLYEAVTLLPPFPGTDLHQILSQVIGKDPRPPRAVNPLIPRDLETICLKSLEKEPEKRYATVKALADDLGRFLKGEPILARPPSIAGRILRKARRNKTVSALVLALLVAVLSVSSVLVVRHVRGVRGLRAALSLAGQLRARGEDVHAEKLRLWQAVAALEGEFGEFQRSREQDDLLRAVAELQDREDRLWDEALAQYSQVLREVPTDTGAAEGYAFILLRRAQTEFLQEKRRRVPDFSRVRERISSVQRHDLHGRYRPEIAPLLEYMDGVRASVALTSVPEGAAVTARRVDLRNFALSNPESWGRTPLRRSDLEPGSYRVALRLPGFEPVVLPLFLTRQHAATEVEAVELFPPGAVPPSLVPVGGVEFLFGGGIDTAAPAQWARTARILMGVEEVTFEEYLEFLNSQAEELGDLWPLEPFEPKEWGVRFLYDWEAKRFLPPRNWDKTRDLPVMGIPFEGAREYCIWKSGRSLRKARDGGLERYLAYRLPTEEEWEAGARGADGRLFPWGDDFDPRMCNNEETEPRERGGPEALPGGRFPEGASPWGLLDMAGNVAEWTSTTDPSGRESVVKGGDFNSAWYHLASPARRMESKSSRRAVGFRVVAEFRPVN